VAIVTGIGGIWLCELTRAALYIVDYCGVAFGNIVLFGIIIFLLTGQLTERIVYLLCVLYYCVIV